MSAPEVAHVNSIVSPSQNTSGGSRSMSLYTVQPVGMPWLPVVHEVALLDLMNCPVEGTLDTQPYSA